jgi:hypothetical protein
VEDLMVPQVYDAKRALFDRLAVLAGDGQPIAGVQVSYAFPGAAAVQAECVYGGGVRFTLDDPVAERGVLTTETDLVSVYIRVAIKAAGKVDATDARALAIARAITADLAAQPAVGPSMTFRAVTQGQGDWEQATDESMSILGLQVRIETDLPYGGW